MNGPESLPTPDSGELEFHTTSESGLLGELGGAQIVKIGKKEIIDTNNAIETLSIG